MNPEILKIEDSHPPTADDSKNADKMMSLREIRLMENRLMTFGFGPENFTENEDSVSFNEEKEAPAIRQRISEGNDVDLQVLGGMIFKYKLYLSSQAGQMAFQAGAMPDPVLDEVGSFGNSKRMAFIGKMIKEELDRRKVGILKSVWAVPKVTAVEKSLREGVVRDRDNRERREAGETSENTSIQSIIRNANAFREKEKREEEDAREE